MYCFSCVKCGLTEQSDGESLEKQKEKNRSAKTDPVTLTLTQMMRASKGDDSEEDEKVISFDFTVYVSFSFFLQ